MAPTDSGAQETFLDALHQLVAPKTPAGLPRGTLSIGLRRRAGGHQWWNAELGPFVRARLSTAPNLSADCLVVLAEGDGPRTLDPHEHRVTGQAALYDAFQKRFLRHQSPLSLRCRAEQAGGAA